MSKRPKRYSMIRRLFSFVLVAGMFLTVTRVSLGDTRCDPEEMAPDEAVLELTTVETSESSENQTTKGSIGGLLRADDDGQCLVGYNVYLYLSGNLNQALAESQTDVNGAYLFEGLEPGSYVLGIGSGCINNQEYLTPLEITEENKFLTDEDSDPLMAYTEVIELQEGQSVREINAGMRLPIPIPPEEEEVSETGEEENEDENDLSFGDAESDVPVPEVRPELPVLRDNSISPYALEDDFPLSYLWNAPINSIVNIDYADWVVVRKKTVNGANCVMLMFRGSWNVAYFNPNPPYSNNYEGSNLQWHIANSLNWFPTIRANAVVPTLGSYSDINVTSEPTAQMAVGSGVADKDIIFAISRGDAYLLNGNKIAPLQAPFVISNWGFTLWTRTATNRSSVVYEVVMRAGTIGAGLHVASDGNVYVVPSVWVKASALEHNVTVNYIDKITGTAIRTPTTHTVYHGNNFTLSPIPSVPGYQFANEWKEGTTSAPTQSPPVSIANVTTNKTIYLYYTPVPADVTITKKVEGEFADKTRVFPFMVYFRNSNGTALTAGTTFTCVGGVLPGTNAVAPSISSLVLGAGGMAVFDLKHGQTVTIKGVPIGTQIRIVETMNSIYTIRFKDNEDAGSTNGNDTNYRIVCNGVRTFDFVNARITVVPTGIKAEHWKTTVLLPLMVMIILGGLMVMEFRRRKK